ncbi:hypothetical protein DFA_01769 [Cavenderia fasciculata]|uniref:UPF3 domain-containing protein n=1 Tax=Cavenderia fasciculata TaxID=261658 RepID=F4PUL9_CACFS|nr:uncharacterized protein DFA_01769 [Cavenderia fasciculata]EGG21883.1 hypothetical protein DFA_01769 [Cavenderia fasciculata]|eukprot:XP_004359734.1 hypothetical protein DFA_01769 [Cavenderia fasciculata]
MTGGDVYVIRNLPYNIEETKLHQIIYQESQAQASPFTVDNVKILEFVQGALRTKESNIPSRCYVKVSNDKIRSFIDHMDGRPFVNSRGVEERALLERIIFDINVDKTTNNKHVNTIESSTTFKQFLQQLNAPLPPPPKIESLTDHLDKSKKYEYLYIIDDFIDLIYINVYFLFTFQLLETTGPSAIIQSITAKKKSIKKSSSKKSK